MTATTDHSQSPPPGPRGRGTSWVVTTNASAFGALTATGASGWRRPTPDAQVRRSFVDEYAAAVTAEQLRVAGYWASVTPPTDGTATGHSGPRVPADVWEAAKGALLALQRPRRVTVTVEPGMSRSGAVVAFLRALATQVTAGEGR